MKRIKKWGLLTCLMVALSGCSSTMLDDIVENDVQNISADNNSATAIDESMLEVHFIDVGQADCALLVSDGHYMLIDAGNNEDADTIIAYLKNEGVRKLDHVVGTHPHEDHIGSLDAVIDTFDVGAVYMPKIMHTSQTFEDVLNSIANNGLKIKTPTPGSSFEFNGLPVEILAPQHEYDDFNNNSIVLKVTSGETSFLFTGDAEESSEEDILYAGCDVKADVLKVGHHGSTTSSSKAFLKAVSPDYAVISVGTDNTYGHPEKEILERLNSIGAQIYRTDLNGTIVCKTDGERIEFVYGGQKMTTSSDINEEEYIGNLKSKKFHHTTCSSLPTEKNKVYFNSREEAIMGGYDPCNSCDP